MNNEKNKKETNNENEPATSTKVVCFLFPIIAFVIYAVNIVEKKKYADKCLIFGLLHIPIIIVATIIIVGALQGTSGTLTKSSNSSSYSNSSYSSDTSSSKLPLCKYYNCTNRVSYSWNDYCDKHSYMED